MKDEPEPPIQTEPRGNKHRRARLHLMFGWWSLLFFISLGIGLEAIHGFKVDWYLAVGSETRRLMWRLAHSHGTMLSLVNVLFAWSLLAASHQDAAWPRWASACLIGATVALPGGFLLGGTVIYGADPGLGILAVPVGAALLLVAVLLTAVGVSRTATHPPNAPAEKTLDEA